MNNQEKRENDPDHEGDDKKVTAAITDEPQEEFISPVNRPTEVEDEHESGGEKAGQRTGEPPRR